MTQSEQGDRTPRRWRARPESWWWISAVVLVPMAVLTGLAALVLLTTTHPPLPATNLTSFAPR